MHDNPQAPSDRAFALDDHAVIALSGPDAVAFAQAQFMSDVTQLGAGQWQWSGWLTPKGRVVSLFMLLRFGDDQVWLVVPDADVDALAASLSRFVFRSKVKVGVRVDLRVSGRLGAAGPDACCIDGDANAAVTIDRSDAVQRRALTVSTTAGERIDGQAMRWRAADLRAGIARLDRAQQEQWTPQQLSLERLQAFSVKKGCYPGQEIVARTHFLGKAKRGLVLVECAAPMAAGETLLAGDTNVGTLVATAADSGGHVGLAVATLDRDTARPLSIAGQAATEVPMHAPGRASCR